MTTALAGLVMGDLRRFLAVYILAAYQHRARQPVDKDLVQYQEGHQDL